MQNKDFRTKGIMTCLLPLLTTGGGAFSSVPHCARRSDLL